MATKKSTPKAVPPIEEYKPSLYLDGKNIPDVVNKAKVGDTIEIVTKVKVTSITERDSKDFGKSKSVSLEIQKMNSSKSAPKKSAPKKATAPKTGKKTTKKK